MSPSLSHCCLEGEDRGRDEKVGKYCGDGLLGYGDDEVRVSRVWGRVEGRTCGMASEVCIGKSTGLSDDLDHLDQQKCKL